MIGYIIGLIVGGLIVGALGRLVHPGRDPMGIGMTIVVGVVSMLAVGLLLRDALGGFLSFVVAVAVAVGIVALWARFTGDGARRRRGALGRS
jgi:uncharacterized membrane protein YeaQ/YmgE (transglycosylase-associated protein family)